MALRRWTISTPYTCRGSPNIRLFAIPSFAPLIALSDSFTLTDTAEAQRKSLRFDNTPTSVKVTSGSADKNVVKVRASGIDNRKRIRYAISGCSEFKTTPMDGRIRYEGSAICGGVLWLTVTASDHQRERANMSHDFYVCVAGQNESTSQVRPAGLIPAQCPAAAPSPPSRPSAIPQPPTSTSSGGDFEVGMNLLNNVKVCFAPRTDWGFVVKEGEACLQDSEGKGQCKSSGSLTVDDLGIEYRCIKPTPWWEFGCLERGWVLKSVP